MTVRTPGSEGLTAPEPDAPDELPVVEQAVVEDAVKAPARRGRYAGVSDEERAEIADTVIENDGSLEDLQEAVRAYWEAKIQPQLEAARGERV